MNKIKVTSVQTAFNDTLSFFMSQIALDLVNPHLGLPTALQHLHPGCVCAVYLVK